MRLAFHLLFITVITFAYNQSTELANKRHFTTYDKKICKALIVMEPLKCFASVGIGVFLDMC
jgi:hypothetical protein